MKKQAMQPDAKFINSRQLQELLNVSEAFIQKYMAARRLPGMVKIGKLWRFNLEEVEKQLATGDLLLPKENHKPL
jgi:excisionase family DNA binding protein